ncbi:hypothetical protein [Ewingella americana]|uniref:Uncharacterized protein n=1 Tax=Ewingella americana TaxID=41202 RepID=A0A502GEC1_9GAMM|nr:hypothetical protein [Ewingella americana]TPG59972.1 hypothetical protein EAH77_15510 [Ewingella americana]
MIREEERQFLIMFFCYAALVFIFGGAIFSAIWWKQNGSRVRAERQQKAENIQRIEKELSKFKDLTGEQEDMLANFLLLSGSSLLGESLFNNKTITFKQLYALNMQRLITNTGHVDGYVDFMETADSGLTSM